MKEAKGSATIVAWSMAIQLRMQKSLIPGRINATCFSAGTDFALKKLWQAFSNSIITVGVTSPPINTGALPLVDSTEAFADIFHGIYVHGSSLEESEER